jgi:hypothetical protein
MDTFSVGEVVAVEPFGPNRFYRVQEMGGGQALLRRCHENGEFVIGATPHKWHVANLRKTNKENN